MTPETDRKRWPRALVGIVVLLVILGLAARKLEGDKLRYGLSLLLPLHIAAVLALSLLHIAGRAARYHRLVLACGPRDYAWTDGARIFLLGLSAAAVTPARAGDLVKAKLVAPHGLGVGTGVGLVLVERVLDLVVVTVCALALSFVVPNQAIRAGAAVLLAGVLLVIFLCSSARIQVAIARIVAPHLERLVGTARFAKIKSPIEGIVGTWRLIFREPTRTLSFLAASLVIWLVEFSKLWLLLRLMGQPVGFDVTVSAYAASLIAGAVSALPFSEGVVGLTLVAVLVSAGGIDSSLTSVAVIVDRAASSLPPIALWLAFAAVRRWRESRVPAARMVSDDHAAAQRPPPR